MPDEEKEVSEWQAWRKKVDAALNKLAGSGAEDDPEEPEPEPKKEPEPVTPPKKDALPPKEPKEEEPAPVAARGPLHKLIFG
jgi:hypothetical protein